MDSETFSQLEISLSACRSNYRYFRSKLEGGTKLLVLVKANAYGHGAAQFARIMQEEGADYLAVALPCEGVELRKAGITLPILVLTAGTDFFNDIIEYKLEPGIPDLHTLNEFCSHLASKGVRDYPVHVKLDTGMHRLGFMSADVPSLCERLSAAPEVSVKSIYSHFAASEDPSEDVFSHGQAAMFKANAHTISDALGYKPMWHMLNSAGIERFPEYQFDMVRLGIGIYGVSAIPGVKLRMAASFKVKVLQVKQLKPEDGTIGYNRWGKIAPGGTVTATIPAGYADGLDRHLGRGKACFLLNGHRVPTIGNICMDMCMLDVTGVQCQPGDIVTIFGDEPSASELAGILGTIPYEILTSVPQRVRRVVVD